MASLYSKDGKRWRITFTHPTTKVRRPIRPGYDMTRKEAQRFADRVEDIVNAKALKRPLAMETEEWLAGLAACVHAKLEAVDLVKRRVSSVSDLCKAFMEEKDVADSTDANINNAIDNTIEYFGADKAIVDITSEDAAKFRLWMIKYARKVGSGDLSKATVSRRVARVREIFEFAVNQKRRWLTVNPFEDQKQRDEINPENDFWVSPSISKQVLDMCTDREFTAIFACARIAAMRPGEIQTMTWDQVNWDRGHMLVKSPKTERYPDGKQRYVPINKRLMRYLRDLWENAKEGEELMFPNHQGSFTSWSNQLERICRQCNIVKWPRPWDNCRATRITEWLENNSIKKVVAWSGHSAETCLKHYNLFVKERDARHSIRWKKNARQVNSNRVETQGS